MLLYNQAQKLFNIKIKDYTPTKNQAVLQNPERVKGKNGQNQEQT
jgi:hypothetical protein